MVEASRFVMLFLEAVALVWTLAVFRRRRAGVLGLVGVGAGLSLWAALVHVAASRAWVPAQLGAAPFLGLVVLAVGVVGAALRLSLASRAVARLAQADLLELQGVRTLFGATFLVQGLVGALPRTFGVVDGVTHLVAGLLGLAAAWALRRDEARTGLAWAANLFGLVDIVVVLSSLAFVLLADVGAHHPMMYAVFGPAAFWACWHVVSLARLVRPRAGSVPRLTAPASTLTLVVLGLALSLSGCRPFILRTVMSTVEPYFHGPEVDRVGLTRLTDHVYTFQWNWYRNLVLSTSEGLVVIDPMGVQAATALKQALAQQFPGVPVARVIYSHYHLDHVRGAAVFVPAEVIAHEKCPTYWTPLDLTDVLPPTRFIAGDTDLSFGGVAMQALDLGLSHTDTLFAFYLPRERVLFTADTGLVKTVAPTGVPDRYAPGYLAALDRLAKLDFDVFVPSHFGYGTRQDLVDWRDMLEFGRALARKAITRAGTFGAQGDQMGVYFDEIYYPLRERYGAWHGFDEMAILNIVRDVEGEGLGH
jgi:glyoxylase-like metal-dependent hydrolase (beta-lactamase superfamily II)